MSIESKFPNAEALKVALDMDMGKVPRVERRTDGSDPRRVADTDWSSLTVVIRTQVHNGQMTDADELLALVNGYQVTQAIHTVVELGIPDLLADGPRSAAELSQKVDVNENALYRVLRALATTGVLEEAADHRFTLGRLGQLLRSDNKPSVAPWAAFVGRPAAWQAWANLGQSVKTGETAFKFTHGVDVWEFRRHHLDESKAFDAAMAGQTSTAQEAIVDGFDFGRFKLVADIGGGNGSLLAAILRANPQLHGIVFDQEHVVAGAAEVLNAANVADRCETVGGDFFKSVPEGADAYLLKWIIHDWQDAEAAAILANCRRAMARDARVLVVEREIQAPQQRRGGEMGGPSDARDGRRSGTYATGVRRTLRSGRPCAGECDPDRKRSSCWKPSQRTDDHEADGDRVRDP